MLACVLCGAVDAPVRTPAGDLECVVCGWRIGDSPDSELPRPRIDVVYYLQWDDRIKIGTSSRPRARLGAIWHQELLAFERGGRELERRRHRDFAHLREGGEWFTAAPELRAHCRRVAGGIPPWHAYARWVADALRAAVS